jgi:site-specific DNA-methyltransferase (adenine-specific)
MIQTTDISSPEGAISVEPAVSLGAYEIILSDSLEWLDSRSPESIHAVVTDPPFGLLEYDQDQLDKKQTGMEASGAFLLHTMGTYAILSRALPY